ncbi:JmjC domain-containing protein [Mycena chlorophos]|uniref:JmjC domain-containing protein n=1 Tax=Mycena chlorophos TaxID=658473 RepID=A0A8H6TTL5_MYCCL|nr:JmjC domain-containing protein [Mycena chlorophos]
MEHKRKSLLATQVKWGAPVGSAGSASTPSDAASRLDALIMADPEKRVIRIPRIRPPFSAAAFGSSLDELIASSPNFKAVPRVQYTSNSDVNVRQSAQPGVPVVVEGLHNHPSWNTELFSPDWLLDKSGIAAISARNVHTRTDQEIPLVEFLAKTRAMSHLAVGGEQERLYGKDVPCPAKYRKFLHEAGVVDPSMAPDGQNLLKNLPKNEQPETLMCYLGVGDTFTPAHTDLCASQGHNLMTYTENDGSSWWFMTASANAWAVRDYFHRVLKNDLDHESHIVTLDELRKAPFPVYITKQKLGDLVLVPPRSAHQVVNAGGLTIKTSWSRMTLDGLALALRYELPLYRRVCRTETYRVKSTIYHTLLRTIDDVKANKGGSKESGKNLLKLLPLFDLMLVDEYAEPTDKVTVLPSADDSEDGDGSNSTQFTCDFCGADIWQAFFECRNCVSGARKPVPKGTGFHICPGCYTEGRSCECSSMSPLLCRPWKALVDVRKAAMSALLQVSTATSVPRQLKELLSKKKGIFRAALLLLKRRTELAGDSSKHCTVARDTAFNHEEAAFQLLRCKPCHSAMCFAHALHERYIHSTNALFAHTEDETHDVFHKAHRTCRITYEQSLPLLKKEELRSPFPDPFAQLACLARTYTTCRPVAPQLKWKSGFYDFTVTITESDTDVEAVAPPPASTMVPSAPQLPPPPRKVRYILDYCRGSADVATTPNETHRQSRVQ